MSHSVDTKPLSGDAVRSGSNDIVTHGVMAPPPTGLCCAIATFGATGVATWSWVLAALENNEAISTVWKVWNYYIWIFRYGFHNNALRIITCYDYTYESWWNTSVCIESMPAAGHCLARNHSENTMYSSVARSHRMAAVCRHFDLWNGGSARLQWRRLSSRRSGTSLMSG